MFTSKTVCIVGAPFGEGQPLEGVQLAPDTIRKAGLKEVCESLGWEYEDAGNVSVQKFQIDECIECINDCCTHINLEQRQRELLDDSDEISSSMSTTSSSIDSMQRDNYNNSDNEFNNNDSSKMHYTNEEIKNVEVLGMECRAVFKAVRKAALQKKLVITLGGDHAIASGSVSGILSVYPLVRVLWIDAHGDCNIPETSPGGNYHGMAAAHIMKLFKKSIPFFYWMEEVPCLPVDRIAYIGLRDLDEGEKNILKQNNIACYTMRDVDKYGISKVVEMALSRIDPEGNNPLHISFDIDSCDPSVSPGTGTKARGGLTYREAHYICESLAETNRLVGADLVEISPLMDKQEEDACMHGDQLPIKPNTTQTVRFGIELLGSLLGKSIL